MAKRSFNQQLQNSKDMLGISEITDAKAISMYEGSKLRINMIITDTKV